MKLNLRTVTTAEEVSRSLAEFNRRAKSHLGRARNILSQTKLWVFDSEKDRFGPGKFVGYSGMDFSTYDEARKQTREKTLRGVRHNGTVSRKAIEAALGRKFTEIPELQGAFREWATNMFGPNALGSIDLGKMKYIQLQDRQHAKRSEAKKTKPTSPRQREQADADEAIDLAAPPQRKQATVRRIVRDTPLVRRLKEQHGYRCQICDITLRLAGGKLYCEAHHLHPLGKGGPDTRSNIIIVCPNHHALLDFGGISLGARHIFRNEKHGPSQKYIRWHDENVFQCR